MGDSQAGKIADALRFMPATAMNAHPNACRTALCVMRLSSLSVYMVSIRASSCSWRVRSRSIVCRRAACSMRSDLKRASPGQSRMGFGITRSFRRLADSSVSLSWDVDRPGDFPRFPCSDSRRTCPSGAPDHQAAAMTASDWAGVRKIMFHFPRFDLGASVQQFLNALPAFATNQWLVSSCVR